MTDLVIRGSVVKSKRPRTSTERKQDGREKTNRESASLDHNIARQARVLEVLIVGANIEWHDRRNCRLANPELFFPAKGGDDGKRAKAICEPCPVRSECLEAGLNEKTGIWGGTSERDRRKIRKARKLAAATLP